MSGLATIYKCADGTDVPVMWEDEADAQLTWRLDDQHYSAPLKPLDAAAWKLSLPARERAFSEAGFPLERLRKVLLPQGFVYFTRPTIPDECIDELIQRCGGVVPVWEEYCRPSAKEGCARLQMAGEDTPIAELTDTCFYAFTKTSIAGVVTNSASSRLSRFLVESFGPESGALTGELTQGYSNATVGASQALWEIAQIAARSPVLRGLVLTAELSITLDALAQVEGGTEFRSAFDGFMQSFGWRSEGWEAASPTWMEQPARPLGVIRRMIIDETPSPASARHGAARRRQKLADDLENRLGSDPAKRAKFRELLTQASSHVSIREDRALWQLIAFGSFRAALLRRGEKMVRKGSISETEDILYLLPEEIDGQDEAVQATFLPTVAERRAQWEKWLHVEPPNEIGAADTATATAVASAPTSGDGREIRGIAASRGVITGPAKVVLELAKGDKLMPGDILVCKTTSPPWTILFGRALAVVTDTGGVLSHMAITAREYGIPCVVGARGATDRIHDGMLITVDGAQGVVHLGA
jgi:phosphohistidine swiveling domain-containing protein